MPSFTVLSWNIDGLSDELFLAERTVWVLDVVRERKPAVVCLQEVVAAIASICTGVLEAAGYACIAPDERGPYFNLLFLRREVLVPVSSRTLWFPRSSMGRHAIVCRARLVESGLTVCVIASHLESTGPCKAERVSQLQQVFDVMRNAVNDSAVVLFAGDMNLRDSELAAIKGLPPGVRDAWEACGSPSAHKYTWDMSVNMNLPMNGTPKCRFDRVFFTASQAGEWAARNFTLVGTEKIEMLDVHPSDHFGVCVDFVARSDEARAAG